MTSKAKLKEIMSDCKAFIGRLYITDKKGKKIRFRMNSEQEAVLDALLEGYSVVVAKPRQIGISTICTAYLFWKAYTSNDPITCISLLHKEDSATEMFVRYRDYYYSIPRLIRQALAKETESVMRFASKASLYAITAGGEGGLRSYSISCAHVSEFCFYKDPDELLATLIAALNGNQLIIESTAKHFGDPMHRLIEKIDRGDMIGKWKLLFFPWYEHKEYTLAVSNDFIMTEVEKNIADKFNLTQEQIYWRREKISAIGYDKFLTEYPSTLEDVFSQKGDCYYQQEDFANIESIPSHKSDEWVLQSPNKDDTYTIGVDVAEGVGKDFSVIYVLSFLTGKPVYIYRSNLVPATKLAERIMATSIKYNNALTAIESNNYGSAVLLKLEEMGFRSFWKVEGKHWTTTSKTKIKMHEDLRMAILNGYIHALDSITITELRSLVVTKHNYAPTSGRNSNGHGDNTIALALAYQIQQSLPKKAPRKSFLPIDIQRPIKPSHIDIRR